MCRILQHGMGGKKHTHLGLPLCHASCTVHVTCLLNEHLTFELWGPGLGFTQSADPVQVASAVGR